MNDTGTVMTAFYVVNGAERRLSGIGPRQKMWVNFDPSQDHPSARTDGAACSTGDVVIRLPAGTEVTRFPPPICRFDERHITGPIPTP